jgi:hypothetical protein
MDRDPVTLELSSKNAHSFTSAQGKRHETAISSSKGELASAIDARFLITIEHAVPLVAILFLRSSVPSGF